MASPKSLKVPLKEYGYHMEVDVRKSDCNREKMPHWHLCSKYGREGSINMFGYWVKEPNVSHSIIKEAESLTEEYSTQIGEVYRYNAENGADY